MSVPRSGASQPFPFVLHCIDALISHKGLPYKEPTKPTIRSHLSNLLQEFPCLSVKIEAFPQSDGRSSTLLLQVYGTIPILFLQVFYNIPIVIWLAEEYPFCAPLVFVTPSPFMIIKTPHPLVDRSGLVSCTHLRSWLYPTSNLVHLVRSLCCTFGQDPPLYSVAPPPHAPDVNTSTAVPISSSSPNLTSALSTSTSSLLGPGSMSQPPPPVVNSIRVPMARSASSPLLSPSLLGPGSLPQHWPSHGHATPPLTQTASGESKPLLQKNLTHGPGVSMAHQQSSGCSSSFSAGSLPLLSSAQLHPVRHHDAGASLAWTLSSTSTTASLLGRGKISQWNSGVDVGRQMDHSQVAPQSSGLSMHPSILGQGQLPTATSLAHYDGSLQLSSSSPTSLLGSGKFCKPSSYEARNSLTYLPSLPAASSHGLGVSTQWQSPPSISHASIVMPPSSTSLLGNGNSSQWHPSHGQMGVSMVHPVPTSLPGSITSALVGPRGQSQQLVNYGNGGRELVSTAVSSTSHKQSEAGNVHRTTMPSATFSNPLLDMKGHEPPNKGQELMNTLIGRLQCDIEEIRMVKESDMLKLMDMEGALTQRQASCKKGVEELQQQRENLEVQLQNILVNTDFLETWLWANSKSNIKIEVDDMFEPCGVLSHQLLECTALDLAIEDELYCLEQAAQKGMVPVDSYLRLVRTLSREQFFQRALAVKIKAAQGQC